MKKIHTIIVTYNGRKWYDACFRSLLDSTVETEIIVVDNNSSDDTVQYIRSNYPSITILPQDSNLGFGRANNIGMSYALHHECDYVFLLNQDTIVSSDCLGLLLEQAEKNPAYGILCPIHFSRDRNSFDDKLLWYLTNNCNMDSTFWEDLYFGRQKPVYTAEFINAAAWLMPRKTLETIGGFDPIFQHYEEDVEYTGRARFHSIKLGCVPKAKIIHDRCFREQSAEEKDRRHRQSLLLEYVDLNKSESFFHFFWLYFQKTIHSALDFDKTSHLQWLRDLQFLMKTWKRVRISRKVNARTGRLWIE